MAVTVDGMPLKPFAGLGSWGAFTPTAHGAMVMGDTVVFQDEVDAAMDAAFAHNAVHHSKQYPSQITVTVVKRSAPTTAGAR